MLAICAFALPIPALAAGCGGDDGGGDEDPQEVLDATFSGDHDVSSGNVDLTIGVSAEGDQGGSFEASLGGPFQGDAEEPNTVPQLDWTLSANGEGGGQSIDFEGGLVVTEDNAFVEYQDTAYEVGADQFAEAKKQLEAQAPADEESLSPSDALTQACEQAGVSDPEACNIDFASWLTDVSNDGTEDVEGIETTHVSGALDVEKALTDFGTLAAAFPGADQSGVDLSTLGGFSEAVENASFDVYTGTDDDVLRKLDFNLAIDPTAVAAGVAVPVDSINVDFSLTLSGVNEDQTIEAPTGAKPIEDLIGQFGGLDALGGLGGGSLDIPGASGGGGGSGDPNAYFDCVNEAKTTEEINACASEL